MCAFITCAFTHCVHICQTDTDSYTSIQSKSIGTFLGVSRQSSLFFTCTVFSFSYLQEVCTLYQVAQHSALHTGRDDAVAAAVAAAKSSHSRRGDLSDLLRRSCGGTPPPRWRAVLSRSTWKHHCSSPSSFSAAKAAAASTTTTAFPASLHDDDNPSRCHPRS